MNILTAEWTDQPCPVTVNSFSSPTGPAVPISTEPLQLFSLFFTSEVMDLTVMETIDMHPNAKQLVTHGGLMVRRYGHTLGFMC